MHLFKVKNWFIFIQLIVYKSNKALINYKFKPYEMDTLEGNKISNGWCNRVSEKLQIRPGQLAQLRAYKLGYFAGIFLGQQIGPIGFVCRIEPT